MSAPLPQAFQAGRLAEELRIAKALETKEIVTLEEVAAASGLDPEIARVILRDFSRAGLVLMRVRNLGNCDGRSEAPSFFYSRTPAFEPARGAALKQA